MSTNLAAAAAAIKAGRPMHNSSTTPVTNQSAQPITSYYQNQMPNTNVARAMMSTIMQDIKEERLRQGLTQRQLAQKAGMSQATITRAEKNAWVSIWAILRIAAALGKSLKIT